MKPTSRILTGPSLAQVAFPLGGIGAGIVSLGGQGDLRHWEIFNRPNKGDEGRLDATFFALRAAPEGGAPIAKVLERRFLPPFADGRGFQPGRLAGLPRFQEVRFRGEYPFAWIEFQDDALPVKVSLEAFNPFIPMNVKDSSIPGAIFRYTVANPRRKPVAVSLLACMQNPIGRQPHAAAAKVEQTRNAFREGDGLRGIEFSAPGLFWKDLHFGTAALTTDWENPDAQTHLYRGSWWDASHVLWDEFARHGRLTPRIESRSGEALPENDAKRKNEVAALCLFAELAPGEARAFTFFVHWHFPNARLWHGADAIPVRTHVANLFTDAWDAAAYTHRHLPRLEEETRRWHATLFASSLPPEVLDAVSSQISILRSPTVLRLADGNLYAWEGCGDQEGCCAGNCTHVWNYEQALAFLFPSLERAMRRIDFGPNMRGDGFMSFRCAAPAGAGNCGHWTFHPCVDGQMGNVMQAYRDWQLSGDDAFLRDLWPNIQSALEYAWRTPNGWDPNKDGVMEGRQHNTYDIEFYGPNGMLTTIYLGALRAAEEMARHLGEENKAKEYRAVYEKGRARVEKELWNGDYFIQNVEVMKGLEVPAHLRAPPAEGCGSCDCQETPGPRSAAAPTDAAAPKYQYGEGCLADQLLGQWEAHVHGLGYLLDPKKVRKAIASVFKNNFRDPIGDFANVQRVYALQDEAGLRLCTWPRGGRPALPFVYCDEVWTGVEYQVAAHLIYEGLVEEGLRIVKAVRARHDGVRRNPWNEFECGWHYARALSSWSLVQAFSGARYSAVEQSLDFHPKRPAPFRCVVAAGTAWGLLTVEKKKATFEVRYGSVTLRAFGAKPLPAPKRLERGDSVSINL